MSVPGKCARFQRNWNLFVKGQEGKTMNFVQEGEPCVSFILELVDNYYKSKVRPSSKL